VSNDVHLWIPWNRNIFFQDDRDQSQVIGISTFNWSSTTVDCSDRTASSLEYTVCIHWSHLVDQEWDHLPWKVMGSWNSFLFKRLNPVRIRRPRLCNVPQLHNYKEIEISDNKILEGDDTRGLQVKLDLSAPKGRIRWSIRSLLSGKDFDRSWITRQTRRGP
jgi:hypothetical protein